MLRVGAVLLLLLALFLGCARIIAPSGGPADETPARLVAGDPPDGALNTGPLGIITISFDERVERASVLDHLFTDPPNLIRRVHWPEDTMLVVEFWQKFRPDTTVAVYLTPGWNDYHYVAQPEWQIHHFATGDSLLPGWFGGKCTFKGNASRRMHLRLADAAGEVERETVPDGRGGFTFRHLPADGRSWLLWAFEDIDGDSLFDPVMDFADTLPDSLLRLTPESRFQLDLALNVIDPDEPGEVTGSFACRDTMPGYFLIRALRDSLRQFGDSLPVTEPGLLPDSLLANLYGPVQSEYTWLKGEGAFTIEGVAPGELLLFIHKDVTPDSLWDPVTEPAWLDPVPRVLLPGGNLQWSRFSFPAADSTVLSAEERNIDSPGAEDDKDSGGATTGSDR
ncbi:MAG: Ig-like domain-containing protein [bacterium]|nr:Ig-like domain-containing protein [bacterium]